VDFVIHQEAFIHTDTRVKARIQHFNTHTNTNGSIPHARHTTVSLRGLQCSETFLMLVNLTDPGTRIQIAIQELRYLRRIKPHTHFGSCVYLCCLCTTSHRPAVYYA